MQVNRVIFFIIVAFFKILSCYESSMRVIKNGEDMALIVEIKVIPSSGRLEIKLDKNGGLKCWLKSAPEQGKANAELVKFLAKSLSIAQDKLLMISGQTSRNKRIKIELTITFDQLLNMLDIHRQKTVFEL